MTFDAFQFTDTYYSSTNNILYNFIWPINNYNGAKWTEYDWVKKVSNQEFTRSFGNTTLHIIGDGSSSGKGYTSQ